MSFMTSQYISGGKPSFFEIVAQDRLMPSLKLASRYMLTVFAQRYFQLLPYLKYHEEIFSLLQLFIENHHLSHYNATFSEHVYGLTRRKIDDSTPASSSISILTQEPVVKPKTKFRRLTDMEKGVSLFLTVGVPYIKAKLDDLFTVLKERSTQPQQANSQASVDNESPVQQTNPRWNKIVQVMKKMFLKVWPYANLAYEGSFFVYLMLYLFKDTTYYSPLLHVQKVLLQRLSFQEAINQKTEIAVRRFKLLSSLASKGFFGKVLGLVVRIGHAISDSSRFVLLMVVLFFKFLEWWYASESYLKPQKSVYIPPPPKQPKRAPGAAELPSDVSLCPLCRKTRVNPTLLSVSGYAFCYTCVDDYIRQYSRCPITHIPATLAHLRRIYEQ